MIPNEWKLTTEQIEEAAGDRSDDIFKYDTVADASAQKAAVAALRWAIGDLEDHWGGDSPVTDALRAKLKEIEA